MNLARRCLVAVSLGVTVALLASACSGFVSPRFGGGGEDDMLPEYVPDDAPANLDDPPPLYSEYEVPVYDSWRCFLSPTYNEDWHDDVLCRKGNESVRPYLREWDDFVEEWEMRESAEEYEAELNAGG